MTIVKIKNVSAETKHYTLDGKYIEIAVNGTILLTEDIISNSFELITDINLGFLTVVHPTGGYIVSDTVSEAMVILTEDEHTITIPSGEEWELSSASLTTTAGTADLLFDGKTVITDADADPVVTVNTTTFGQVFKVTDSIVVKQKAADGTFTLTLKGVKKRSIN